MLMNMDNDNDIPTDPEAYYEAIASQEEIYLEETEEQLRAILISYDPTPSQNNGSTFANGERKRDWGRRSISGTNHEPRMAESPDEQLEQIAEELITGDSDEPPICNETVVEMLKVSLIVRRLGPI